MLPVADRKIKPANAAEPLRHQRKRRGTLDCMSETNATPSLAQVARPIFMRWERLRLPYNLILAALTIWWHSAMLRAWPVWIAIGVCAIGANVCFLAGPVVESYLAWLELRSRWIAPAIFLGGVVISVPLVYLFPLIFMH